MGPTITHSFASKEIRAGGIWKVYLNAFDPDEDMKAVYCTLDQPGAGSYPVSITRIRKDQQRRLSGYLYLNTAGVAGLIYANLVLNVQIQNQAGRLSKPVSFLLSFNPRAREEDPPPGLFQDEELGPIMVSLQSISGGP